MQHRIPPDGAAFRCLSWKATRRRVPFGPGRLGLPAVLAAFVAASLAGQTRDARQAPAPTSTVLYASVGPDLTQYDFDPDNAALVKRGSVTLPANVQEGWPHPSGQYLYIAWSDNGGGRLTSKGGLNGVTAFRIDPASGALAFQGKPATLPSRAVFITTDLDGTHLLAAHNNPSGLTVLKILPEGTIGTQVEPGGPLDFGVYGHQVRMDPSGRAVILVTRGNAPAPGKAEDPGALRIFNYRNGVLTNRLSIAPGGGFGYQVRHLDFHPSGKWVFVTLERQNQIHVYRRSPDGTLGSRPLFVKDTLAAPAQDGRNLAASIHVHPNGRFLYVANRASGTVEFEGKRVFAGGENSIAVFSINQETGEPTLIERVDTHGFEPRTFSLDSNGRYLVVANQSALLVRGQAGITSIPAGLVLFRIRSDGRLEFIRKYDVETGNGRNLFWARFVTMPQ